MKQITAIIAVIFCSGYLGSAQAQSYQLSGNEVVPAQSVSFKPGTPTLTKEGIAALETIKSYLQDKTYISLLRVEGHVSGSSNDQSLSESRAFAVGKWLAAQGIDCSRLLVVGFGDTKPAGNTPAENNRISFINAALRGHLIGGMPADGGGKMAGDICQSK